MSLDLSGVLLDEVRLSSSVNPLVFSPRNIVSDQSALNNITSSKEYCLAVGGQSSNQDGIYINDPNLIFKITKNDAVTRFSYDNFNRRWSPSPGSSPQRLGLIKNTPRLRAPVPSVPVPSNFQIYLALPRLFTFNLNLVDSFGSPTAGNVEVLKSTGELNFSIDDLSNPVFKNLTVYCSQSDFFDRPQVSGAVSSIEEDGSYLCFINPIPLSTETPLIRIGFRNYLAVNSFPLESSMPTPMAPNTANFALDTGRVLISDSLSFAGEVIYYDGVISFTRQLTTSNIGTIVKNNLLFVSKIGTVPAFINLDDSDRYVIWANISSVSKDYYFSITRGTTDPTFLSTGTVFINTVSGDVLMSTLQAATYSGNLLKYTDTYMNMEDGVTFKVFRSGANTSGFPQSFDFFERYQVSGSTLVESLTPSPFVYLPITPLDDSFLSYDITKISRVPTAGYTGPLNPVSDTSVSGLCYDVDYINRRVFLANRETVKVTLTADSSAVKIPVLSVIDKGVLVKKNNSLLNKTEYDFDPVSGVLNFLESEGESNPLNISSLLGSGSGNIFTSETPVFSSSYQGSYLFIGSGDNAGYYQISSVINNSAVSLDRSFVTNGTFTVDIKSSREIVVNRVWKRLNPPMKKFILFKKDLSLGTFNEVSQDHYTVISDVGQINFRTPADPGDIYRVDYKYIPNPITNSETNASELLVSKIRLEQASYAQGSRVITFNPENRTIVPSRGFRVIIDGVTAKISESSYIAPNKIDTGVPLTNQLVWVDYWVSECLGGEVSFNTVNQNVVTDYPRFVLGSSSCEFNGDLTPTISAGSSIYVNNSDLYIVSSISFNGVADKSTVSLSTPIKNNFTGSFLVSEPLTFSSPGFTSNTIPNNSRSITIAGNVEVPINSAILVNNDPFYVISRSYDSINNRTNLILSTLTRSNYITPNVKVSESPIYLPSKDFRTKKSAVLSSPFTLFLDGPTPRLLSLNDDYTISDNGVIRLRFDIEYGQSLLASYVSRLIQPAGTEFEVNCAYQISPDEETNRLLGQSLVSNFNIYSPDVFYYRALPLADYVPEVIASIAVTTGFSTSGPNISGAPTFSNANNGVPSIFYDERRFSNNDVVARRYLLFYNDLVNLYEDFLSDLDGRVVGGTNGKFRFNNQSITVQNYSDIQNDIDDYIKVYDLYKLNSTNPFVPDLTPFYSYMYEYNALSRLFPTKASINFIVNDKVGSANNGSILGNLGYTNIASMGEIFSARSNNVFTKSDGFNIIIPTNGDSETLNPPFTAPSKVYLYDENGIFNASNTINSISGNGPYVLTMMDPVGINSGTIVLDNKDFSGAFPNRIYFPNTDLNVDYETGTLTNNTQSFLVAFGFQREIFPNEILNTTISFSNKSLSPRQIPVLYGSTLSDDGYPSLPPLKRFSELVSLNEELLYINEMVTGNAVISTVNTIVDSTLLVSNGDEILFTAGPNANLIRTVIFVVSPSAFVVAPDLNVVDLTPRNIIKKSTRDAYELTVQRELDILNNNLETPPPPFSLIGTVDNELLLLDKIIGELGIITYSGSGNANGNLLTVPSANFASLVDSYVYVSSGSNIGLYKIISNTPTTITIETSAPFYSFASPISVNFSIISEYSFFTEYSPEFLASTIKQTYDFYQITLTYSTNINYTNFNGRISQVENRINQIFATISGAEDVLKSSESLYDLRYLWISQRTDKSSGFIVKRDQAIINRKAVVKSIRENARKLIALQVLNMI